MLMKTPIIVVSVTLLSGCALFAPPSEKKARQLEEGKAQLERDRTISERAAAHEKKGMSTRDARAVAETEYRASGGR
jgi:hypothetical protein